MHGLFTSHPRKPIGEAVVAPRGSSAGRSVADWTRDVRLRSGLGFRSGLRLAALGDSLTRFAGGPNTGTPKDTDNEGFVSWLPILTKGRLRTSLALNFGIGGDTLAQMRARLDAVFAAEFDLLSVMGGANDLAQGRAFADIIADYEAILDRAELEGVPVLALTPLPRSTAALTSVESRRKLLRLRNWLMKESLKRPGLIAADTFAAIVDPANADPVPLAGTTFDGTHTTPTGAYLVAKAVADVLNPLVPKPAIYVASAADVYHAAELATGNLLGASGMMLGTTGTRLGTAAGVIATGCSFNTDVTGATVTGSKVTTRGFEAGARRGGHRDECRRGHVPAHLP